MENKSAAPIGIELATFKEGEMMVNRAADWDCGDELLALPQTSV